MSPERRRFGVGVRGCAIPDEKISRRATRRSREKFLAAVGVNGGVMASRVLGGLADVAEGRGDFVKPRVKLDGFGQFLNAEINRAAANLVTVGVGMNAV